MVLKRLSLLTPFALASLSLWGCGGGSSSSTGASGTSLTRANTQLNQITSGQQPTNDTTLNSTLALFTSALKQDPTNPGALFGQAVCQTGITAGTLTDRPTIQVGVVVPTPVSADANGTADSTGQSLPPAPPNGASGARPVPPSSQLGLLWHLQDGVSNPYTLLTALAPIANLRYGLIPFNGYAGDDVATRQQELATLDTVAQKLQTLESNPNFATTLTLPASQGGVVNIGLPEVYLFEAYVQSLRVQLSLSLAYNRDPGVNNPLPGPPLAANSAQNVITVAGAGATGTIGSLPYGPQPIGSSFAGLDKNGDGKISPDEYLPASPYLTLRDASLLQKAQQALQAVADRETKGIQGVFARPADGSGRFLIPNNSNIHTTLDNALNNVVPLVQQAANGPVTLSVPDYAPPVGGYLLGNAGVIPGNNPGSPGKSAAKTGSAKTRRVFLLGSVSIGSDGTLGTPVAPPQPTFVSVTFNLAAWFANPPADLKAFAPTYTLDSNKVPDLSKTTYPDPTFGGLFPNGLPATLML